MALALAAALLLAGCSYGDGSAEGDASGTTEAGSTTPPGAPGFTPATILIDGAESGPVLLQGEVADTDESRAYGLTGRRSIPDDYGMAFILFEEQDCCFWMRDTLVPLSVAFFDREGTIVDIEDMEPCPSDVPDDECPLYGSDEPYIGALEVKQGLFEEWGVTEGDRIRIVQ
jgi:uncharacterized protein